MKLCDDFTVDEIKAAILKSKHPQEVHMTTRHYARHIRELQRSRKQHDKTMAIQINNLADYQILILRYHTKKENDQ